LRTKITIDLLFPCKQINVRASGKKGATAREIDQEMDAILLIIGIVYLGLPNRHKTSTTMLILFFKLFS
jgi:hypothetical protein